MTGDSGAIDIDLFSGARGWEARAHDLTDPVGLEIDPTARATSEAAGFRTLLADVAAIDPRHIAGQPVRLLLGSPPCQTYSAAGGGAGRRALATVLQIVKAIGAGYWPIDLIESTGDVRTGLVVQPLRYALALRPESIAWEQVPAVLPVWEAAAEVLRAEGYSVATGVLRAEQYGVPQTRRRAVLIASRARAVELPRPTHSRYYSHNPARLDPGVAKWVSMREALGVNSPTVAMKNMGRGMVERYGTRPGRTIDEPAFTIRAAAGGTEPGGFVWKTLEMPPDESSGWVLRNGNQAKACVRPIEHPAGTLFFGKRANWVAWQRDGVTRKIAPAEAATLQTFPAAYPFEGGKSAVLTQIGNAVPPLLGRVIITAALGAAA